MNQPGDFGQIVTFYSYKGGTGRSMALANVACLLARQGSERGVLMLDWDLEAPGLHRYFRERVQNRFGLDEKALDAQPGLVDLFWSLAGRLELNQGGTGPTGTVPRASQLFDELEWKKNYVVATDVPSLSLMKAGAFVGDKYAEKVARMPWEAMFHAVSGLFEMFAEKLMLEYSYVLIDSRTGVTDVSGICTMLMPEKLVVVFTPNRQSLFGVESVARKAIAYRMSSGDLRPLMVYPMPSRIELNESELRTLWRSGPEVGYQPIFEKLFREGYGNPDCNLQAYFDSVNIPHVSRYAYGERLAVLEESTRDRLSSALHYDDFTERLVSGAPPWEDVARYKERQHEEQLERQAEGMFARLTPAGQDLARQVFERLTRVGGDTAIGASIVALPLSAFDKDGASLLGQFAPSGVVSFKGEAPATTVQLAHEAMPRIWRRLRKWLEQDRAFLLWRDGLDRKMERAYTFLSGPEIVEAERWRDERGPELNRAEHDFIDSSRQSFNRSVADTLAVRAAALLGRGGESIEISLLLAVESLRRNPNVEADRTLRGCLSRLPRVAGQWRQLGPVRQLAADKAGDALAIAVEVDGRGCLLVIDCTSGSRSFEVWFDQPIVSLALSDSGRYCAASDRSGLVKLCDAANGREPGSFKLDGPVKLQFGGAAEHLTLAGKDAIFEWDPAQPEPHLVLSATGPIDVHALSEDGSKVCLIMPLAGLLVVRELDEAGHEYSTAITETLTHAAFSPDNNSIVLVRSRTILDVFNLQTRRMRPEFNGLDGVTHLLFSSPSSFIAVYGGRVVSSHTLGSKRVSWRLALDKPVISIALSRENGMLAVADSEGEVRILDVFSGQERFRIRNDCRLNQVCFLGARTQIAGSGENGFTRIWDVSGSGEETAFFQQGHLWDVAYHPARTQLATASVDRTAVIWDLHSGKSIRVFPESRPVTSVAFSPEGAYIATSSENGDVRVYDARTDIPVRVLHHPDLATSVTFSSDGRYLATSCWDGRVRVFDLVSGEPKQEMVHPKSVWHVQFNPDGTLVGSACEDGLAYLWTTQGSLVSVLPPPAGGSSAAPGKSIRAIAFSPDGTQIGVAGNDRKVRIFDTVKPCALRNSLDHGGEVNGVAYSWDGKFLVTAADDNAARVWDVATGIQLSEIQHDSQVTAAVFSPDGSRIATADSSGAARIWVWRPEDLIAAARQRVSRELTAEEWSEHVPDFPRLEPAGSATIPGVVANAAAQLEAPTTTATGSSAPADYSDLLIRVGAPRPGSSTPSVEAVLDRDSLFYGGTLELDPAQLLALELDSQAYGHALRKALFSEPIQRAYDRAIARALDRTGGQLRVRLQIDDEVGALQAYRWERVLQGYERQAAPIAMGALTPFSRFVGLPPELMIGGDIEETYQSPLAAGRIRLSVCISNPDKLPDGFLPVAVEDEVEQLRRVFGGVPSRKVEVTIAAGRSGLSQSLLDKLAGQGYRVIPGPLTVDRLVEQLIAADIVHFVGHGMFRPDAETGGGRTALYLENDDGALSLARDEDLLARLRGAERLARVVFLAGCESARRSPVPVFVGLAGKLVRAGSGAALAVHRSFPADSEFETRFYSTLFATGIVDASANEARAQLLNVSKSGDPLPALFMRVRDGRLIAPDPVGSVLSAIAAETAPFGAALPLPLDVVEFAGRPTQPAIEQAADTGEPALDLLQTSLEKLTTGEGRDGNLVLLFGSRGSGKSHHLKWLAHRIASQPDGRTIPIYLNVAELSGHSLETLLLRRLAQYWPELNDYGLHSMLSSQSRPRLRLLVDGEEALSERQRGEVLSSLMELILRYRAIGCLYVSDLCFADDVLIPAVVDIASHILVIKPISEARTDEYLTALRDPATDRLRKVLREQRLFDLASQPWLLARMIAQARRSVLPESRVSVLKRVVDDAIARVNADRGMRARAGETLYALAWATHSQSRAILHIEEAFAVMKQVRGNREYVLDDLLAELVDQQLLSRIGSEQLRFSYALIQEYCCAKALEWMPYQGRDTALNSITSQFGQIGRLAWWQGVLVLLSELLPDANRLIELILPAGSQGQHIFVAGRCIQACDASKVKPAVVGQVVDGLLWRSRVLNEPRESVRIHAISSLADLMATSAIPDIAASALDRIRKNFAGQDDFEFPAVRRTAAMALVNMGEPAMDYLWKLRPAAAQTLELWRAGKVEQLGAALAATSIAVDVDPAVAALLLGQTRARSAFELLAAGFNNAALPADTRWCIADSLGRMDPRWVRERVLAPFWAESGAAKPTRDGSSYDRAAYLTGKISAREPAAFEFLLTCLYKWTRVSLKGRAMKALASLYTSMDGAPSSQYRLSVEQAAAGDFTGYNLPQPLEPGDAEYLQLAALQALSDIGHSGSIEFVRAHRQNWTAQLERQFFLTGEDIHWRNATAGPAAGE